MLLYGLRDDGDVFDLFTDQIEAEVACLGVAGDEPDLAAGMEVVELEAYVMSRVWRSGSARWGRWV